MTLVKTEICWSSVMTRGVLFLLIWWMLTNGAISSWWIGIPAVLLAAITSAALLPPVPLAWYPLLRFIPFFLLRSLLGGADVAWRAFHPRIPIAPELIKYPLRLPPGLPQVFMANTVNLLPGTLSAALEQGVMSVHVLDAGKDFLTELRAVEHSVAQIFGTSLKVSEGD